MNREEQQAKRRELDRALAELMGRSRVLGLVESLTGIGITSRLDVEDAKAQEVLALRALLSIIRDVELAAAER